MSSVPMRAIYDYITSNPGKLPMELAQELKKEFNLTRIVDALDVIKATRGAIADERGTSPRV